MDFQVIVQDVIVKNDRVCIFIASDGEKSYKFTITKKRLILADKVTPGAKLFVTANLELRTYKNINENALYVLEM